MADSTLFPITNVTMPPLTQSGAQKVALQASSTGAASALTATLFGVAGKTTWISGFSVTGAGATAASVIIVTINGPGGASMQYYIAIPAGATTGITPLIVTFNDPIPASGPNVSITVNVPSFGAGNTSAAVNAYGFQQA